MAASSGAKGRPGVGHIRRPSGLRHSVSTAAQAVRSRVAVELAVRRRCPLLASIGVPLGIIASSLTQPWCVAPLVVCAWWWAPSDRGPVWLVAVGRGILGIEWAYGGLGALASFPRERLLVEVSWVSFAALLAVLARAAEHTS